MPKEVSTKCLKEVAAPPVPAPDPRSWTQRAGEIWTEALGGPAPHGRIGKAFKPLVRAHGAEDVLATWRRYLTTEPGQFVTPEQFASKYQVWRDGRRTGSRLAEVDVDDLAGWDRLQRGDQP